jgi:polyphosphate kinase 2 (PPK2 family)
MVSRVKYIIFRKCFLHISHDEQKERFRSRLQTARKQWKVEEAGFTDRKLWPQFQTAYEKILSSASTVDAPWYIVPEDRKWYRDVGIAGIVLSTLRSMNPMTPRPEIDLRKFCLTLHSSK